MPIINQVVAGSGGGGANIPLTSTGNFGLPIDVKNMTTLSFSIKSMYSNRIDVMGLPFINTQEVETITDSWDGAFYGCTNLSGEISFPRLKHIPNIQYALRSVFNNCPNITKIYLPVLQDENHTSRLMILSTFANYVEFFDLRYVEYCGNYGFLDSLLYECQYIHDINLNSLSYIGNEGARTMCYLSTPGSALEEIRFPMLTGFGTNPFYSNAFTGRENLTIHFRKDMQATVESLANYATLWGAGTGSTVVFDLVGTLTGADSNSYTRSEIDSVYASETAGAAKTATAWKNNNVVYYTSGGSEPSVSDTIYSDAACTQSVTTITAIA